MFLEERDIKVEHSYIFNLFLVGELNYIFNLIFNRGGVMKI